jgi:hypothetical protein
MSTNFPGTNSQRDRHASITQTGATPLACDARWIEGISCSGKTAALIDSFCQALQHFSHQTDIPQVPGSPGILVLAAIGDNRLELSDRITAATQAKYPFRTTTPLGFFEEEVTLFWSLLIQKLHLAALFPIRLRPENEQELATQLWQPILEPIVGNHRIRIYRLVRRILDIMQLAALAGVELAAVPQIITQGLETPSELPVSAECLNDLLQQWRAWCLDRGFLTYSLIAELYGQHLLPDPIYQIKLRSRYAALFADDVDEYPAICQPLFQLFLAQGQALVLTFNPEGSIRLGLGADPDALRDLRDRCQRLELPSPAQSLRTHLGSEVLELVTRPVFFSSLPESIQTLQTTTRAQLLRQTADMIVNAIQSGQVEAYQIAVVAPGLDAIARHALVTILHNRGIRVEVLNEQRSLCSLPLVRSLLTLLALVYPQIGRLLSREAIAELLVVFTQHAPDLAPIDPVRAGLLADACFAPHPDSPALLPSRTFPRWDRLGYQASATYEQLLAWLTQQQTQLAQHLISSPVILLDRAIQRFFLGGSHLPSDQLTSLRSLMETAQHYWTVEARLRQTGWSELHPSSPVQRFIQLLRNGTVTADPYPVRPIGTAANAVTLATLFQYRSSRRSHAWQFWFDAGSPNWLMGGEALFAAPLFLRAFLADGLPLPPGKTWTLEDQQDMNEQRLQRQLLDLMGRVSDRIVLCHSDLSTQGQEQLGSLLTLVNAAGIAEG